VTSEAKALVPSEPNHQCQNDRPCRVWSSSGETEPYWWIKEAGVNLDSPENAKLREAIDCAKLELGINDEKKGGLILLPATMEALRKFEAEVKRAKIDNSAEELLSYAEGVFGEGLKKTAGIKELADFTNRIFALELTEWVINLAQSPFPRVNADTEANFEKSALGGLPPLG